jgi:hypothetical protein
LFLKVDLSSIPMLIETNCHILLPCLCRNVPVFLVFRRYEKWLTAFLKL